MIQRGASVMTRSWIGSATGVVGPISSFGGKLVPEIAKRSCTAVIVIFPSSISP